MLQVVDPQQYGIEPRKANELTGNLDQIKSERQLLVEQYHEVVKMDIEDPKTSKVASELRKRIKENRTKGIEVWHKNTKDYFLKGGQFVDAIKRLEIAVNERMEENLELIEKHQELKEQKLRDDLKSYRLVDLSEYMDFVPSGINLGTMSNEEYQKIYSGAKLQFDAKVAEDLRLETERLENQRLDVVERNRRVEIAPYVQFLSHSVELRLMSDNDYNNLLESLVVAKKSYDDEQEQIRLENERLKKEAEQKEAELQAERDRVKAEQDRLAEEKRIADEAHQNQLKAEQEKAAKLEAEIKAKKQAEEKAEKERLAKEQAEKLEAENLAKAPIKEQLKAWIDQFKLPETSVDNEVSKEIIAKFESFRVWSVKVVDNL